MSQTVTVTCDVCGKKKPLYDAQNCMQWWVLLSLKEDGGDFKIRGKSNADDPLEDEGYYEVYEDCCSPECGAKAVARWMERCRADWGGDPKPLEPGDQP